MYIAPTCVDGLISSCGVCCQNARNKQRQSFTTLFKRINYWFLFQISSFHNNTNVVAILILSSFVHIAPPKVVSSPQVSQLKFFVHLSSVIRVLQISVDVLSFSCSFSQYVAKRPNRETHCSIFYIPPYCSPFMFSIVFLAVLDLCRAMSREGWNFE
jgi:hypothetical protein